MNTMETMDMSFNVDIDLDDDNNHSNDDCELHNDYDNQKLFDIYESYLNKSDISDTDSEPELSFNDHFYQLVTKTSVNNRSIRRISCFADLENQKSITRMSSAIDGSAEHSLEESLSESTLPWNLSEMSETQVIDLVNGLSEELINKAINYPKTAANHMKSVFDQQIQFFNDLIESSENKFINSLIEINVESDKERIAFSELIDKEFKDFESKSERMSKLKFELKLIQEISDK